MIGIYDTNDILITGLVETALSNPDVIEVKNRTLDGKWHIQTIGDGASTLNVEGHLTLAEKAMLDSVKRTSGELKVIFDGKYYIGLIDGRIEYERRSFAEYPMFKTKFTLLVNVEGAVE